MSASAPSTPSDERSSAADNTAGNETIASGAHGSTPSVSTISTLNETFSRPNVLSDETLLYKAPASSSLALASQHSTSPSNAVSATSGDDARSKAPLANGVHLHHFRRATHDAIGAATTSTSAAPTFGQHRRQQSDGTLAEVRTGDRRDAFSASPRHRLQSAFRRLNVREAATTSADATATAATTTTAAAMTAATRDGNAPDTAARAAALRNEQLYRTLLNSSIDSSPYHQIASTSTLGADSNGIASNSAGARK